MVLKVENMVKSFNKLVAVNGVSLQVKEGDILGLLGPNGAGKSTFINAILGLTKVDEGTIEIFGNKISRAAKKKIGFVPQEIAICYELNAYDNVAFFGKLYGLRGAALKEAVKKSMEFTGLWDRRKENPKKYSGGMQRRLNIACAIVHEPELLIMDEPTVGVDPQSRNNILETIKKLNENGTTVIYTSHYMEEIEEICTKVAIIDLGKLIAEGTSDSIKNSILTERLTKFEVEDDNGKCENIIKDIEGVISCSVNENGNALLVKSKKNIDNLPIMIERLVKGGVKIISVNIEQPTLEAAFLSLTGKTLRD
ncbi:ABC transporter ATP-binding protein [Ruminiclostridium papyrosolvens]|uniref:Antibiotic ABC transporter ATP-binding protein n=1 Tax=Ruminiclostridium papyrosolvens C7 TaxID=1330534 RepID=U4R2F4_9FIRM|nr:ABC transporter ATP-binding protein [Ruminiclostridium papyrosolvens]EPR12477.1 antibiotic ABC transporter ATP-binding protein [Ruminiclostridium papyrosolvens C7]